MLAFRAIGATPKTIQGQAGILREKSTQKTRPGAKAQQSNKLGMFFLLWLILCLERRHPNWIKNISVWWNKAALSNSIVSSYRQIRFFSFFFNDEETNCGKILTAYKNKLDSLEISFQRKPPYWASYFSETFRKTIFSTRVTKYCTTGKRPRAESIFSAASHLTMSTSPHYTTAKKQHSQALCGEDFK